MRLYPPGFLSLSASVVCERFGFFLLASLLLLYLNERLGFTTAQATDILGCFIAATYISPLLAGAFTDGRLGIVRVASLGYLIAAVGYVLLAAESRPTLYVGLTLVALGAGAAKLAPQSLATRLFAAEPELHDRGLTLIYLLANVSALVSPVIGETARAWLGWPAAFALASLSLVAAWLILQSQSGVLRAAERETSVHSEASKSNASGSVGMLLGLCVLSVLLTVPHMQACSTLLLWARDNTNLHLLGWELPVPYVASLHAGLVLAVSPLLARALLHLKTAPGLPTAAAKIAIGVAATSLAYVPLVIAALLGNDDPWRAWAGCSAVWRCWQWANCWSARSARRSCCGSLRLPVAVDGSGPGTAQQRLATGWLAGLAGCGTVCRTRCTSLGWWCCRWSHLSLYRESPSQFEPERLGEDQPRLLGQRCHHQSDSSAPVHIDCSG